MTEPEFLFNLDDLYSEFDEHEVRNALKIVSRGDVTDLKIDAANGMVTGMVLDRGIAYHASATADADQLLLGCDCDFEERGDDICLHTLALLVACSMFMPQVQTEQDWTARSPSASGAPQTHLWPESTPEAIRAEWSDRLENLTVKEIRELGEQFKAKLKGIKREEVLNGMLDVLCDQARLTSVIERLQPDTRRLLDVLSALWDVNQVSTNAIMEPLQNALEKGQKARPLKACFEELAPYRLWDLPQGIARLPHGFLALRLPDPALFEPFQGEPSRTHVARPFQFSRLLLRLLLLGQAGWLSLQSVPPGGWPGETAANRRDREIPIAPEPSRLAAATLAALQDANTPQAVLQLAARLAEVLGLWLLHPLQSARKEDAPANNVNIKPWLRLSSQEQSRRLFEAALALPSSLEMDLAAQAGGFTLNRSNTGGLRYDQYLGQLAQARLRLARLLTHVPAGQWIDLESILRMLYGLQPDWQLAFKTHASYGYHPAETLWAVTGRRRLDTKDYLSWRKIYGLFHQAILVNTFHGLGLLDVGYRASDDTQPVAVRLTRFGEFLLGRQPDFVDPAALSAVKPLEIRPDGTFELNPEAAPFELIQLMIQIAEPVGKPAPRPGGQGKISFPRALSYRLSEAGVGQAFDAGWTLDQITAGLAEAGVDKLPDRLLRQLQAMWQRYGRLQLYEDLALIQFADDYCLPELLANTRLSQILLFTFSPRLIAIRTDAADQFLAELQTKGYTPKAMPPAVRQEESRHGQ